MKYQNNKTIFGVLEFVLYLFYTYSFVYINIICYGRPKHYVVS